MTEGKVDNRGSVLGTDPWPDLPTDPGGGGFAAGCGSDALPAQLQKDSRLTFLIRPISFRRKMISALARKDRALRAILWHRLPELSRSGKEKSRSIRFDFSFPCLTISFSQRQACRVPFSARVSIHLRGHASPRYAGILPVRPLYGEARSPFSTCHQTA